MNRTSGRYIAITMLAHISGDQEITIAGDLDLAAAGQLRDALDAARGADASTGLRMDLSQVTFLDCCAVGILVGVQRAAVARGAAVVVTAASPIVERLLSLFDLAGTFGYPITAAAPISRAGVTSAADPPARR